MNPNVKEGDNMKTLIVYSSKYGTTKKCAEILRKQVDADIHCCDCKAEVTIKSYDLIVLGTSVYMGQARKNMKRFIKHHQGLLSTKSVAFFICSKESDDFKQVFSPLKINNTTLKAHFGYELYASKMRGLDKFVTKKISGGLKDVYELNDLKINDFSNGLISKQ
jgi:menaquinone-dependent protoporphyrinogen oxidase